MRKCATVYEKVSQNPFPTAILLDLAQNSGEFVKIIHYSFSFSVILISSQKNFVTKKVLGRSLRNCFATLAKTGKKMFLAPYYFGEGLADS